MSAPTLVERTKALSDRLAALMAQPEPGLFTWVEAVTATCREIGELANPAPPPAATSSAERLARAALRVHTMRPLNVEPVEIAKAVAELDGALREYAGSLKAGR